MAHFGIKLPTLYICMHLYTYIRIYISDALHPILMAAPSAQGLPNCPVYCPQWRKTHLLSPTLTFNPTLTFDIYQKDLALFPLYHDQYKEPTKFLWIRNLRLNTADHILYTDILLFPNSKVYLKSTCLRVSWLEIFSRVCGGFCSIRP